ncbi:MAG TPA: ATP synthase F1 subunit gamma [Patescibacteria group bacterium]|jgi:F-type H+-transporting ATPase subunit gamma|nr:ATP synthase F1 subunit gamma [Patescibacteria group bacterium]
MPSTRQLKGRIRSVKSTKQITKAMQMVAASKMRRAQEAQKATVDYTQAANELLTYLAGQGATRNHPLFMTRDVRRRLLIVITSDKGLAGAYNSNVLKRYLSEIRTDRDAGISTQTITVGRKASQFSTRLKDVEVRGTYDDMPDEVEGSSFHSIVSTAAELYRNEEVDAVDIVYTEFVSSLTQRAKIQRILPAGYDETDVRDSIRTASYEPSAEAVLEGVAYRLVGAQIYQALLDGRASEHSMRMVAMKNATDNASDLIDDLTLAMNKARQAAITQELAEISGGAEAMK